jgi:hypothetical protein
MVVIGAYLHGVATCSPNFGTYTILTSYMRPLDLPPDRPHIAGKARLCKRVVTDAMPPMKHLAGLGSQGLPALARPLASLDHGLNIA